ncbi:MAG: hypothetical protein VX871_10905, partial [Pseudomonadota bacterium]|nr:hypothetical protein [Pseudomonadota bacterium]
MPNLRNSKRPCHRLGLSNATERLSQLGRQATLSPATMWSPIMHRSLALTLTVFLIVFGGAASAAMGQCPADPLSASYEIWQGKTLAYRQVAVSRHPCGRWIRCTGGSDSRKIARSCKWL